MEDIIASWELLPPPSGAKIITFKVAAFDHVLQVISITDNGAILALNLNNQHGFAQWQCVGENTGFTISPGLQLSCASPISGRLDLFAIGADGNVYTTWWTQSSGWENNHNWTTISTDSQKFKASQKGNMAAISRVNGQVEILVTDSMQNVWKNWWS